MIKLGQFCVDITHGKLIHQGTEIAIEPKLFQLLLLFIERPNQVLTREAIIERLWLGRYVTDNAMNKQIANLRKILNDDPKNATYIQTVPKIGYRLICPIEAFEKETASAEHTNNSKNSQTLLFSTIFSLILLSILLFTLLKHDNGQLDKPSHTLEITRQAGQEHSPRIIPSTNQLLYLREQLNQKNTELWLKDLTSGQASKIALNNVSMFKLIAGIQDDSTKQVSVYFAHQAQKQCYVVKAQVIHQKLENLTPLFDCSEMVLGNIYFDNNKNHLFYSARLPEQTSFQLYEYDLNTNQISLLFQPSPLGMGNHAFDVSPDGERMLIMNTNSKRNTQFYVLHLTTNQLVKHQQLDYFVSEAIWHHDGKHVYYFAPPPSHQILLADLEGKTAHSVVSVSDFLSRDMIRHNDNKSILFSTRSPNFSNQWLTNSNDKLIINNSTVYDIIPALFHHENRYIFSSKRSGKSQLYLGNLANGNAVVLSNFEQYYVFQFIQLSPDDKTLLIATQNNVWKISRAALNRENPTLSLTEEEKIFTSQSPITNIDWIDNHTVAVTSLNQKSPAIITTYSNNNQTLDLRWKQLLLDHKSPEHVYLIEQTTNRLFKAKLEEFKQQLTAENLPVIDTGFVMPRGYIHLKIFNKNLYYATRQQGDYFIVKTPLNSNGQSSKHLLQGYYGYDVAEHGVMVSHLESLGGDIHRTVGTDD
ncbi:winged helix-turn-helix domain-containing protein [Thalassotalea hakodatensis]|uniref:winged helix-turn-helix domain-containing protein n=1 Tax=Thalassotalea hakodatensis TaxID=3030492 RepID=UPI002572A2EE|nr:winged helix-turn-helix domain-containing protein [Thalassotalea hakodatensis]